MSTNNRVTEIRETKLEGLFFFIMINVNYDVLSFRNSDSPKNE